VLVRPISDVLNNESGRLHGDMRSLVAGGARSGGGDLRLSLGESSHEDSALSGEVHAGSLLSSTSGSPHSSDLSVSDLSHADVVSSASGEIGASLSNAGHTSGMGTSSSVVASSSVGSESLSVSTDSLEVGSTLVRQSSSVSADSLEVGSTLVEHSSSVSADSLDVGTTLGVHSSSVVGQSSSVSADSLVVGTTLGVHSSSVSGESASVGLQSSLNPFLGGGHLSVVPLSSHKTLSVLQEVIAFSGCDAVIHGGNTSTNASGNVLVRVVGVSLGLGTSVGGSSGEADESLLAVVVAVTISLAVSKLVLGGPSLVLEFSRSVSNGNVTDTSGFSDSSKHDEGSNESLHVLN